MGPAQWRSIDAIELTADDCKIESLLRALREATAAVEVENVSLWVDDLSALADMTDNESIPVQLLLSLRSLVGRRWKMPGRDATRCVVSAGVVIHAAPALDESPSALEEVSMLSSPSPFIGGRAPPSGILDAFRRGLSLGKGSADSVCAGGLLAVGERLADAVLRVEPLRSGRSRDVHGQVTVRRRTKGPGREGEGEGEGEAEVAHWRVDERGLHCHRVGEIKT